MRLALQMKTRATEKGGKKFFVVRKLEEKREKRKERRGNRETFCFFSLFCLFLGKGEIFFGGGAFP